MSIPNTKPIIYRILIIEDDPGWYQAMEYFLKRFAQKHETSLEIKVVENCEDAHSLMGRELFHSVTIDLRVPEKPGGPLTPNPHGSDLAIDQARTMPLTHAHIYTAWAKENVLTLYNKILHKGHDAPPIWEKHTDNEEDERDRYSQKEWAQRILALILPYSKARKIPLVNERDNLRKKFSNLYHLGESIEFAVKTGRAFLPPSMAHSCAIIHRWFDNKEIPRYEYELPAFNEILYFAEVVQHWLWVQASAWLTAFSLPHCIVWPSFNNSGNGTRASMEKSLHTMLIHIAASKNADWALPWLSHLHIRTDEKRMNIIDALTHIRMLRNQQHHQSSHDELPWEQLAVPLRIVFDAAAYLASYPVLFRPKPAPDNRWRFTVLRGEVSPLPENEWTVAGGELGKKDYFTPEHDTSALYQLWPCPDGSYGLLNLWPFAEQKKIGGRLTWLILHGLDGRDTKRVWERSVIDGRVSSTQDIHHNRLNELKILVQQTR